MIRDPALWASLPLPALLISPEDRIVEANAAAETFFNLSSRALTQAPLWERLRVLPDIEPDFARARAQASALSVNDVEIGLPGRAAVAANLQIAPLQGAEAQMLLLIAPRQMASRMMQNASSSKAARTAIGMAEMLTHEIKNPLAGITGAAQLLSMGLKGADLELTDLIVAEGRRIVTLLEQVEQFGNLSPPQLKAVNIHDALDRARQSASVGFGAHMYFVEDYDPSLPPVLADGDQILQVLLNLIRNAAEAGRQGGTIRLRSFYDAALRRRRADGSLASLPVQIEIIDDGPGIAPDLAADIFEPFVSGRDSGTGLGLALVSKLIGDVGGWISVDSAPGRTAFRISLPLAPRGAAVQGQG